MPLEEYRRKRDFSRTPEPAGDPGERSAADPGAAAPPRARRFVVQKHRATRLHYDVRLEIDGVLASWAVPRGPSLDPKARRMAVHVEDHPLEYFDFEGVIPAGQYGGGDVIVWDWGTWEPEDETPDPAAAIAAGELKLRLEGEKLAGRSTLVRTSGGGPRGGPRPRRHRDDAQSPAPTPAEAPNRPSRSDLPPAGAPKPRRPADSAPGSHVVTGHGDEQDLWLLLHKRDEHAVEGWDAADHPRSVRSGRTNDEVKAEVPAIWVSAAPASQAQIDLSAAVAAPLPRRVEPMQATLADAAFDDDDWLFEIKWDGFRVLTIVADDAPVRLLTRHGNDARTYFPSLLDQVGHSLSAREAVLDGEVVALDERGRPDFSLLQQRITTHRAGQGPAGLVYMVFDLLHLDGRSLLAVPLEERKKLLRLVLRDGPRVRYVEHVARDGRAFLDAARQQDLEGIVAKHRRSRYEPGRRSTTWLKVKIRAEQELVVGGWTPERSRPTELGALVVGVHEDGRLRFAGKVGSGFSGRTRRQLAEVLAPLATPEPPFAEVPPSAARGRWGGDLKGVTWVRPEVVIRAALGGWSRDGLVRQASYRGLDPGRDPAGVVREVPLDARQAEAAAEADLASGSARESPADQQGGTPDQPELEAVADGGRPARARPAPGGTTAARDRTGPSVDPVGHAGAGQGAGGWTGATAAELTALCELPAEGQWQVGGQTLSLTNLDKVIFPPRAGSEEPPVTKRDLIAYFAQIAPVMLAHLAGRPLNLHRFPNGIGAPGFWQKDIPASAPPWLTTWEEAGVPQERRRANTHLVADGVAALCWLGNQTSFEVHAWTATCADPWRPTFALIDIDPGPATTWEETLTLARLYRTALDHLGVRGYPKTTGSRGIQAWIPVERGRYSYAQTSAWVESLSRAVGAIVPDLVSWEWATRQRGGKARLDYTQNAAIKTLVAPYAVRPRPGAPVSMPIAWHELDDPQLRSDRWTIRDAVARVDRVGDLFAAAQSDHQVLPTL
jgi:DNA ligase D-like protein (predicted ligase)/DNA ligase D-like protein (predicted polymerase)/DNA ligase D-like protein (predicted 3'-phosphoesterase)